MPDTAALALFISAALVLLLVPGPAVLFIIARSMEQGRRAGIISALGLSAGAMLHILAAALGLSAIVAQSAVAFGVVKYVGAGYLIYLGIRTLLQSRDVAGSPEPVRRSSRGLFVEGFVVNALNPKAALFFLAFLPQFVDPARGSAVSQILLLGAVFLVLAIITDVMYALLAGSAGKLLASSEKARRRQRQLSGVTYVGLGLYAALSSVGRK